MGAEQSRMYPDKHRLLRKRLSLPLQLLTTSTSGCVSTGCQGALKPTSCELSQTTPGSSFSQQEGQLVRDATGLGQSSRPETENHFSDFEQDVLLSTWPLIAADLVQNGWLVFQNAFSIFPELPKFFNFE
ncbi:unnamed protein product [Echinostoma caproni]|uniref:FAM220 domain-containing protein n=1 Tax=Echinostoma caproni TaxID=27848 RepID=A0A183ADS4_9TREM|nr:unnamed protein product [Echinostoma caproni]